MISTIEQLSVKPTDPRIAREASPWLPAVCVSVAFALSLAVWFAFDNRVPATDEAGHILNSLTFADLFHHARPFRSAWWHELLTVNSFYPPFVYAFSGLLKLVLGTGIIVDKLCLILFDIALTLSTFGSARLLTRSSVAATVAAICINLYPQNAMMSHLFMLDFPLTAMVSVAFFSLLWWRQSPCWSRTGFAMAALASACMTKQIAAGFLILPGIWCLVYAVQQDRRARSLERSVQIFGIATAVLLAAVPWLMANYQWIHSYAAENAVNMGTLGAKLSPVQTFIDYFVGLFHSASPLLSVVLLVAACRLNVQQHRQLLPAYLLGLGGIIALSSLTFTFPLDRYASSALIAAAIVTGYGAKAGCERMPRVASVAFIAVGAVGALQLLSFCFCPVPLSAPAVLVDFAPRMSVFLREFRGAIISRATPAPDGLAWGQKWVVDTVSSADPNSPVWLNILPSQGTYNPHSFELLAKQMHAAFKPTTCRTWTIMGDKVEFSPERALWFHWYLLTTGDQGNKLRDEESSKNYKQLIAYVRTSGKFELKGKMRLPDQSELLLYRQR